MKKIYKDIAYNLFDVANNKNVPDTEGLEPRYGYLEQDLCQKKYIVLEES